MDAQTKRRATKHRHKEDAKPWKNWKRKSAFNTFLTIEIPSDGYCDLTEFLKDTKKRHTWYHRWRTWSAWSIEILFDSETTTFAEWSWWKWSLQYAISMFATVYSTCKFRYTKTNWWSRWSNQRVARNSWRTRVWVQTRLYFGLSTEYSDIR